MCAASDRTTVRRRSTIEANSVRTGPRPWIAAAAAGGRRPNRYRGAWGV